MPKKIGFIGLGLIGGSIAKTIHRIHPEITQIAYDRDEATINLALAENVIREGYDHIDSSFADCDYIFLCAPVMNNGDFLAELKQLISPDTILTDVGSVKNVIHKSIAFAGLESQFIGGHPMAGTEKSGYTHSTSYMLENAFYVLTPTSSVPKEKVDAMEAFIDSIDALPMVLDYKEHDFATASISHLPHVISATLVNLVKELDNEEEVMRTIAAGGFKDITRISSSSPDMLQNICLANKDEILHLMDCFEHNFKEIRAIIEKADADGIHEYFEEAKEYRDSFCIKRSGPLKGVYQFFCDLIDEAGGIATIATILATNNINIKNIGIVHNREFQQGVLRIELYKEEAYYRAIELLRKFNYTIYEK